MYDIIIVLRFAPNTTATPMDKKKKEKHGGRNTVSTPETTLAVFDWPSDSDIFLPISTRLYYRVIFTFFRKKSNLLTTMAAGAQRDRNYY